LMLVVRKRSVSNQHQEGGLNRARVSSDDLTIIGG